MDRGGIGSHDRKERAYYLELHVLVPVLRRLADLVHNGVDEPPGKSSVALWLLIVRVEAIIWVVAVQQPMRHKLLNMVEDLLGKTRYLGIQRQLHEAEVFVRAENLIISVGLDLLDRIAAQVSELLALLWNCLTDLIKAPYQQLLVEHEVGAQLALFTGISRFRVSLHFS